VPPWQQILSLAIGNDATLVAALAPRRRAETDTATPKTGREPRPVRVKIGLTEDELLQ
jgi:hypothetical protein